MLRSLVSTTSERHVASELSMTLTRVFVGLSMTFAHGLGKLPPGEGFIGGVGEMGFPAPALFAWAAVLSEVVGGLMLAAGLLTRPAAVSIAVTMAVAAFVAHGADPFRSKELAIVYLLVSVVFAVRGAGRWSVDRLLERRR